MGVSEPMMIPFSEIQPGQTFLMDNVWWYAVEIIDEQLRMQAYAENGTSLSGKTIARPINLKREVELMTDSPAEQHIEVLPEAPPAIITDRGNFYTNLANGLRWCIGNEGATADMRVSQLLSILDAKARF